MPRFIHYCSIGLIAFSLTCLSGCGDQREEVPMHQVSGTVKLDGKLVAKGTITFEGKDDEAKGLPASSGEIINGKYEFIVSPGQKTVRIEAPEETGEKEGTGQPVTVETIPAKYNVDSELTETVKEGENTFNFDLKSEKEVKQD